MPVHKNQNIVIIILEAGKNVKKIILMEESMANKLDKRMIGIKELLYIIKENHEKIFRSQNATFLSLTDNKNKSCLELLIPDKYWKIGRAHV